MKNTSHFSKGIIPTRLIAILAGLILTIGNLQAETFGRMVSFGDSLADTGNVFSIIAWPPFPYYEGRFSNGPVWPEYLSEDLELELVDMAFGGAFTNDVNLFDFRGAPGLPGLTDQVYFYLASVGGTIPGDDLITIIAGSNDFFGYIEEGTAQPVPIAAGSTLGNIELLIQRGAQHLVVIGVPDLSCVPAFAGAPEDFRKQLKELVKSHNSILKQGLYDLRKTYGTDVVYVNLFEEINNIVENPADYGITNVTTPGVFLFPTPVDTFLFWDAVHPTTTGHALIAEAVMDALVDHYDEE